MLPCRPDVGTQLVIAEKPSVAQDYARALGGGFQKHEGYLESDEHIVSWAIGHLVELAEPEEYDEALKRWSIKTLPVLPEQFKLRPDARNKKQLDVLKRLIKRDDVDEIVNGCDAGREGELIFQYIMDVAKTKKPVRRLWVSSMTKDAIREGFENLRPGEEMEPLAAAARSRSEADWLVGMNATRAATVKGRSLGGVVSLGRVQTPTLALIVRRDLEIDAFEPQTYFQVDARFGLDGPRTYIGRWFEGKEDRTSERERGRRRRRGRGRRRRPGRDGQAHRAQDPLAAPLRPDEPPARRQQPLRALGAADARRRPAPVRGIDGRRPPHLSAYPVAVPPVRPDPDAQGDRPQPDRASRPCAPRRSTWPASTSCRSPGS